MVAHTLTHGAHALASPRPGSGYRSIVPDKGRE